MVRGRKSGVRIVLTAEEREVLEALTRARGEPAGLVRRARIILLVAEGSTITEVAGMVGINRRFVYKWAKRFLQGGVAGLRALPRMPGGRKRRYLLWEAV